MKKLFILLVLAVSTMTASAQFLQAKKGAKGKAAVGTEIKTGFRFGIETGVTFGDYTGVNFEFTPGYQFNKYFYAGLGTGLYVQPTLTAIYSYGWDYYTEDVVGLQIPVYAEMKAFLPLRGIAKPYVDVRGGYAIAASDSFDAGLFNIGLGVELKDHWNIGLGYFGEFPEYGTASNGYFRLGYRF